MDNIALYPILHYHLFTKEEVMDRKVLFTKDITCEDFITNHTFTSLYTHLMKVGIVN